MVAVIGRPAECAFRKIARADDESAVFVCDIHYDLCALTRLTVFENDIVIFHIVRNIGEMLCHVGGYIHRAEGDAQPFGKQLRIAAGALRCAEAGHCHTENVGARTVKHIHDADGNEEGKSRIEPARQSYDKAFRVCVLHTFFEPECLYGYYFFTSSAAPCGVAGNKRRFAVGARQHGLNLCYFKHDASVSLGARRERRYAAALTGAVQNIGFGIYDSVFKSAFGKDAAVFGDQVVTCENKVGRRFALAGVCVCIAAHEAGRLHFHETAAEIRL